MELEKNLKFQSLFDIYSSMLSSKQEKILRSYLLLDETLSEIGEENSISRQAVLDTVKKAEEKLLEIEEKLHLLSKKETLIELVSSFENDDQTKDEFLSKIKNQIGEI